MYVNDYGKYYPSVAENAADVIAMTDIGGIGTLIYHTFRFKDYENDYLPDETLVLSPLVYKGYEPDIDKERSLNGSELFVELYNLAERISDVSDEKSFDVLIVEFCRTVAHPYDIDTLYLALTEDELNVEREGKWISEEATFGSSTKKLKSFCSLAVTV